MIKNIKDRVRRFRHFKNEAYYTLNGWRFADLKRYIDKSSTVTEDSQFAFFTINEEINRIVKGDPVLRNNKIALVSCLPPDDTGIARYSLQHIIGSHIGLDAFSVARAPDHFMLNSTQISKRSSSMSRLFPLSTLLSMDEIYEYDNIVFVIGNSDHNIEVYRAMETFVKVCGPDRAICYLHDPCCHNVTQMSKSLSHEQYIALINKLYADKLPSGLEGCDETWRVHHQAVEQSILGCRAITDIGIRRFIVNSLAAQGLIINDILPSDRAHIKVHRLYHPVFPLERGIYVRDKDPNEDGELRLGTFGMPGASKRTDLVIQAASELVNRGIKLKLIIAGYQTERYLLSYFAGAIPSWIEASSPENEHDLQCQMAECDFALQFRSRNLGESSGIVPTLLQLQKTVLVSNIGSFRDYGDSVLYFDGDYKELADLIQGKPKVDENNLMRYIDDHRMDKFSYDFAQALYS